MDFQAIVMATVPLHVASITRSLRQVQQVIVQTYVYANKIFTDSFMEGINPEDDYRWIHD